MNARQLHVLKLRETDVASAMQRLSGNEQIYTMCLYEFLSDPTLNQLNVSINYSLWDDAFTAAHALKGVAGNMGFIPLMHNTSQLIVAIRGGRTKDIPHALEAVNSAYRDIVDGIHQYFAFADDNQEEIENENQQK